MDGGMRWVRKERPGLDEWGNRLKVRGGGSTEWMEDWGQDGAEFDLLGLR